MKSVLITGAQGYIGSVLVPYLSDNGYSCTGIDTGFFKDCILFSKQGYNEHFINCDIRDIKEDILADVLAVVHLSGISNDPFGDLLPEEIFRIEHDYSLKIANWCMEKNIKFIYASSCSVYGKSDINFLVSEDSQKNPQTPYSSNKLKTEAEITKLCNQGLKAIFFRFATVYGLSPRMRFDLVVNMLAAMSYVFKELRLNSNGMAWRPFLHIKDLCKAVKYGIEYQLSQNETPLILNVGNNEQNFRVIDLAKIIIGLYPEVELKFLNTSCGEMKKNIELIKDRKVQDGVDTRSYRVNFDRIHKIFPQFYCKWNIEKGVEEIITTLQDLNFNEKDFSNINYYRLQKMEEHFTTKRIGRNLRWS